MPVQSLDDLLGPATAGAQPPTRQRPTLDDLLGPEGQSPDLSGDFWDGLFALDNGLYHAGAAALGSAIKAFGQGASEQWGANAVEATKERNAALQESGVFGDLNDKQSALAKAFNTAIMRPAIYALVNTGAAAKEAANDLFGGTEYGLLQAPRAAGTEAQKGNIGRAIGAEQLGQIGSEMLYRAMSAGDIFAGRMPPVMPELARARALGVIGEGEEGFYEATPLTPENAAARVEAAQAAGMPPEAVVQQAAREPASEPAPAATSAAPAPSRTAPPAPAPPTVDDIARQMSPAVFQEHDGLIARQESYTQWLRELNQKRLDTPSPAALAAQNDIDTILGKVHGVESRLTDAQTERLNDAVGRLDKALQTQTPDEALVRENLLAVQHRLWDLAPDVRDAYQQARTAVPEAPLAADVPKAEIPATGNAARADPDQAPPQATVTREEPPQVIPPAVAVAPAPSAVGVASRQPVTEPAAAPISAGAVADTDAAAEKGSVGTTAETKAPGRIPPVETEASIGEPAAAERQNEAAPKSASRYGSIRPIEGTGETKTRTLSEGVEAKAIEDGLTATFGDLPEYHQLSMADQAQKALRLLNDDPALAKGIAMGSRQPPKGLLPESMFVAVEKRALAEGDVETLRDLATTSRLSTAATTMGQRIRTLGERDPESPVGAITEVQNARAAALAERTDVTAAKQSVVNEIKAEIRKSATAKPAWQEFIKTITCEE